MEPLIEIRNLNHYYGKESLKKQILFDINLAIDPGEIVLLTGPSGSGKTTLLSLIGGLRSVQEGSLRTVDTELNNANESLLVAVRRHTGYIFQAHNLLPFMTARQNVQMSVELHENVSSQEAHERSIAALEAVGLGQHTHHYPDKLSGGQKQRVAIARALVNRPKLILADEPTAALDSHTGREVVNLMQTMAREQHCTILLVTHDNRILDIADRIVHLEDGKLQQDAKIQQKVLVTSPQYASQNEQTASLTIAETIVETVAPDTFSIPERFIRSLAEANAITHTSEGETEPTDAQSLASDVDQQESNDDLKPRFKTDETESTELTVVEPTIEPTVARWHDRLSASELDRIIEEVTQEDFQMYVDLFSLADETKADETKTAELTVVEPAIVQWNEQLLNPELDQIIEAVIQEDFQVYVDLFSLADETKADETKVDETKTAELTILEPAIVEWNEQAPNPELDQIVEAVTKEDFQMYVEWFSFRVANELKPTELYTIACIADSSAILQVLKSFLSDELFSVVLISDPIKALTQLIRVKPNLIILDITMPDLNGYQLCKLLRRNKYFKDLPIIFITGDESVFNPKAAQKVGVKDCLIKPFNQSDLIVKLFPYLA